MWLKLGNSIKIIWKKNLVKFGWFSLYRQTLLKFGSTHFESKWNDFCFFANPNFCWDFKEQKCHPKNLVSNKTVVNFSRLFGFSKQKRHYSHTTWNFPHKSDIFTKNCSSYDAIFMNRNYNKYHYYYCSFMLHLNRTALLDNIQILHLAGLHRRHH